jgi:plasmid stability protein
MPTSIELDDDVLNKLQERAAALELSWEVVANGLLRALLQVPKQSGPEPLGMAAPSKRIVLQPDWYRYYISSNVDVESPGLYEWNIEGRGIYIGKYRRISRPTREYRRNVQNLLNGASYRLGKPTSFRRIHRELGAAYLSGRTITLTILENAEGAELLAREQELIKARGNLNGSKQVTGMG